jgi:hypothetical protein
MRAPDTKKPVIKVLASAAPRDEKARLAFLSPPPPKRKSGEVHHIRSFSDANWREIAASLAAADVGVDLDAVTIYDFVPGKRGPLRDVLQVIAYRHSSPLLPSVPALRPAKQAKTLQPLLTALEHALVVLDRTRKKQRQTSVGLGMMYAEVLYDNKLARYTADLKERIAELKVAGRTGNKNARRNDYWRELTRLWLKITDVKKYRRKHLTRFLVACTPLTLFPDRWCDQKGRGPMTAQQFGKKVNSFVGDYFR